MFQSCYTNPNHKPDKKFPQFPGIGTNFENVLYKFRSLQFPHLRILEFDHLHHSLKKKFKQNLYLRMNEKINNKPFIINKKHAFGQSLMVSY